MEEKFEHLKGKAKEAAGNLTDDEDLEAEGRADQGSATVKEKVEAAEGKMERLIDKAKDKLSGKDT